MDEDFYKILEVSRSASKADVEKAYRRLARKYHPDLNPDDTSAKAKFQQVQRAYEVLGNPEKRKLYDRYGSSFEAVGGGSPFGAGGAGPGGFGGMDIDLGDLFRGFGGGGGGGGGGGAGGFEQIFRQFGGGTAPQGRRAARRGADREATVQIPFAVAVAGGETQFALMREGRHETLSVKIPAGITDGQKIRLRGQGEPGLNGAPNGDLFVVVQVTAHPCYRRKGLDLEVDLPVTLAEAALGAKVDLPTPAGTISLTVPAGTSSGQRLRIKGQGIKAADGQRGDLFAVIQIQLPKQLDQASQNWIKEFERQYGPSPRAGLQW